MLKKLARHGVVGLEILSGHMKRSVRKFDGQTRHGTSERWPAHTYFEEHDPAMIVPNPCCMHLYDLKARNPSRNTFRNAKKSIPIPTPRYNTVPYGIFVFGPEARVCLSRFGLLSQQPTSSGYLKGEREKFRERSVCKTIREMPIAVENIHLSGCRGVRSKMACVSIKPATCMH